MPSLAFALPVTHASPALGTFAHLDAVWRANELAPSQQPTVGSGFAALDAELPNAGWPTGALIEILQTQAGSHEWRLLLPALRDCGQQGRIVLVGSPHWPNLAALASMGVPSGNLILVEASQPAERLWAAEQVLCCREVAALMVWLPQARSEQLRRLHLASASHANGKPRLVFAFRPVQAAQESSAAPLRLRLGSGAQQQLEVQIIKRKGPALDTPLQIAAQLPAVLALRSGAHNHSERGDVHGNGEHGSLHSSSERGGAAQPSTPPATPAHTSLQRGPLPPRPPTDVLILDIPHAVDRTAAPRRSRKHPALAIA
jgi:protein ImuA